ncbi:uncharacterized protein EMPS_02318 [Entomortierella parvispora]|uniref:Septin-type G domain-containing protein n=1 Tax=Entomortierella parvispora TaxID=205924 RepID=A0A9P3LTI2_9FUNG|nr:uncharacterized protein EMPS_02318 [Entomortierella parvispora]
MTLATLDPFATGVNDQTSTSSASLRFLLLGDVGVGRRAFVDTFIASLEGVNSNTVLQENIPRPNIQSSTSLSPSAISLPAVHVQTSPVFGPGKKGASSPFDDPLGLVPPNVQTPGRDLWFVTLPGYSSTTNPSSVLSMTDDYLNHHLLTTTSIFSPTIPSAQLAWFLMTGGRAHTLPTCAFYFVLYELKPVDILYMKLVHERVNLVPIITKADTVSSRELWILKRRMIRQLKLNGIKFHTFGMDLETVEAMTDRHEWGAPPFAVSSRRDQNGQLPQSELGQLIKLCLYEQLRHSQEEAARKVIEWRRAFGPSGYPATTVAEKVWGERAADDGTSSSDRRPALATDTRPTELTTSGSSFYNNPEFEAQLISQYVLRQEDVASPPSAQAGTLGFESPTGETSPVKDMSTKPYGVSMYTSPNLTAAEARLSLIHQTTGMSVDSSTRPNEIMDDKVNTVHTLSDGQYAASGAAIEGTEFKVEVPNSGTYQQMQYHQPLPQQEPSYLVQGGYPTTAGAYIVPDMYQPGLAFSLSPGEALGDIWEATELGDIATVQRHLNNGASPDQRNASRSTLLHRAAWQGSRPYGMMNLLISYGANVNLANENGNTVLQNVLMKHDDPALIKLLLDNGAETNIPNKEGMNTLEVAALFNKLDSAKYLLDHDLESSEPQSITNALTRARSPDKKLMKMLLKSWQGKEGEKKRSDLVERLLSPPNSSPNPVPVQGQQAPTTHPVMHNRSLSQLQNQSQSQIADATSIHSTDTQKGGDGNANSSKASSIHYEGRCSVLFFFFFFFFFGS